MIELQDGQFELLESTAEDAGGLAFGDRRGIQVRSFDPGTADMEMVTERRPVADGLAFGRTQRGGRLYSFEMTASSWTPALYKTDFGETPGSDPALEALGLYEKVESAWASDRVRLVPGAVQVLRWRMGGRTRRVYGRPNRCAPGNTGSYRQGVLPFSADFQAQDDLIYSDLRKVTSVGIVPSTASGASWPFTWPVLWRTEQTGRAGTITVGGTRATPITITINGPVFRPTILIPGFGEMQINVSLNYDQALYIDTRPWNQGVRSSTGANLAGALDVRATPLQLFRLPPGTWQVLLKGTDPTGTASMTVEHRDAYSSF